MRGDWGTRPEQAVSKETMNKHALLVLFLIVSAVAMFGDTATYVFRHRSADHVYRAAYEALSMKLLGGWNIGDRSDTRRSFTFYNFSGLNSQNWAGVSGTLNVTETEQGSVLTISTNRRTHPGAILEAPSTRDACMLLVQVVRGMNIRGPVRCN